MPLRFNQSRSYLMNNALMLMQTIRARERHSTERKKAGEKRKQNKERELNMCRIRCKGLFLSPPHPTLPLSPTLSTSQTNPGWRLLVVYKARASLDFPHEDLNLITTVFKILVEDCSCCSASRRTERKARPGTNHAPDSTIWAKRRVLSHNH